MVRLRVGIILLAIITGAVSLLSPGTGTLPDPKPSPKPQGVTPSPPKGGSLLPALTAPRNSLLPLASSNLAHFPQGAAFTPLAPIVAAPVNAPLAPNVAAPVNAPSPTGTPYSVPQQLQQHQAQLPPSGAMIPYLRPGAPLPYTPRENVYYFPPGAAPFSPIPSPGRHPQTITPGAVSFLPPGAAPLSPPPGQQYPYPAPSNIPPQYGRSIPLTAGSPSMGQNSPVNNNPVPSAKRNLVLPLKWQLLNSPASQIQVQSAAAPFSPIPSPGRHPQTITPGAVFFLPPGAAPLSPPPGQQYPYPAPSNIPQQYGRSIPQTAGLPSMGQNSPVNNNPVPSAKGNLVLPLNWQLLNSPASQIQVQSAAASRSSPPRVVLGRRNRFPFFSPNPTKPSSFMQILDFLGRIRATKELDCKTVPEALSMNLPKYYPLSCDYKCPPHTECRNVGPVGFCCPPLVTDQLIWMVGLAERAKVLGG